MMPTFTSRLACCAGFGQIGPVDCGLAGLNGKMMEVAALVGLRSLDRFDRVLTQAQIAVEYNRLLSTVPGMCVQKTASGNRSSRLYEALLLDRERFGLDRNELDALRFDNITARRFLDPPVHRMTCYRKVVGDVELPATERVAATALALPFPSDMTFDEVRAICGAVAAIQRSADAVRARLASGS